MGALEHARLSRLRSVMAGFDTIDEVRTAPGVTPLSEPAHLAAIDGFASEIAAVCANDLDVPMLAGCRASRHSMALDQLRHHASLLAPGRPFEDFAHCWKVPDRLAPFGYYCVANGLGMSGEDSYIPAHEPTDAYPLEGQFEAGMVICVESYFGDPDIGRGVKLEDQYLITGAGAELLSTSPHLS